MALPPAVTFDGIVKRFGAVEANRGIGFTVAAGSIHGIVGENGAGKSTLAGILYGIHRPDGGALSIRGEPVRLASPHDAIARGIGMVHQHFMLVEPFTVLENLMLGLERGIRLGPARRAVRASLEAIGRRYGLVVEPDALVADLPLGARQRVEILKALVRGAEILILDEPTAVLTPDEAHRLFDILRRLKAEGKTVLLITHKLGEIMAVTDRVTVLRGGRVAADLATAETDETALARLMIGHAPERPADAAAAPPGAVVLACRGLSVGDRHGRRRLDAVDLELRAGEIVGVAGVAGNGQSELLGALAGLVPAEGAVSWRGAPVPARRRARALRRLGLAHIPEDRLRSGLVPGFMAWESYLLGHQRSAALAPGGILRIDAIRAAARSAMAGWQIRPADERLASAAFSGGNQQKLVAAREIDPGPAVLLAGQPTRGVDLGAVALIHARLRALRAAGSAILLVSSDLDEILALADRILVMAGGRIVGALDRGAASEAALGLLMAGLERRAA